MRFPLYQCVLHVCLSTVLLSSPPVQGADWADTIETVKTGVVAVGTDLIRRAPRYQLRGTGFVVTDGLHVITNAHVVQKSLDTTNKEQLVIFVGQGPKPEVRHASVLATDKEHDLALLHAPGKPLKALRIGRSEAAREGQTYLFTGYPIGAILGLYPTTHRGMISSISPIVLPQPQSKRLNPRLIARLRSPFNIYQLDGTAFPGNSGSPLYSPINGEVVGVVNMVLVKGSKEHLLSNPSGIVYAVPSKYILALLATSQAR